MARHLLYRLQEKGTLRAFCRAFRDGAQHDPAGAKALRESLGVADLETFRPTWQACGS